MSKPGGSPFRLCAQGSSLQLRNVCYNASAEIFFTILGFPLYRGRVVRLSELASALCTNHKFGLQVRTARQKVFL
jgi:hypothetical protein